MNNVHNYTYKYINYNYLEQIIMLLIILINKVNN